ncbi:hypothetical protein JX266_004482 [Neoarthrinium moseri]|nr:hypothetical protein JX266_004482 [Neoarthrinium moseri]
MAAPKQPRNITVVGGAGSVGAPIVASLLATGIHQVSVITRAESTAEFPASVRVHRSGYADEDALAAALAGQHVLVLALAYTAYDAQVPLIKAAARARVPYVVPCEFGSDATHGALNAEIALMRVKKPYRDLVESLGASAWIGVVNNPWFDFCMRGGFLGVDLKRRTATLLDGGRVRANFTTLGRVGRSLAALLSLPGPELARHGNGWVYFSSFAASQRDILDSALRATGTAEAEWAVTHGSALEVRTQAKEATARGDHMAGAGALFALMFSDGFGGDYGDKVVDYARLGLEPEESLDQVVKELVDELGP